MSQWTPNVLKQFWFSQEVLNSQFFMQNFLHFEIRKNHFSKFFDSLFDHFWTRLWRHRKPKTIPRDEDNIPKLDLKCSPETDRFSSTKYPNPEEVLFRGFQVPKRKMIQNNLFLSLINFESFFILLREN